MWRVCVCVCVCVCVSRGSRAVLRSGSSGEWRPAGPSVMSRQRYSALLGGISPWFCARKDDRLSVNIRIKMERHAYSRGQKSMDGPSALCGYAVGERLDFV